ncbi:MAG: hypothetical protein Fur007_01550 [Rhodoferax sp.]
MNTELPPGFLAGCEAEALHRSGAIQPHGALIVSQGGHVTHVSQNLDQWIPDAGHFAVGHALPEPLHSMAAQMEPNAGSRKRWPESLNGVVQMLDVVATRAPDASLIWELWPSCAKVPGAADRSEGLVPLSLTGPPPGNASQLQTAREQLVHAVLQLSGFARVMYYLFREDGDGEVVAEARSGQAFGSYLGLRYPASDIPLVARELYLRNPWRLIPDANASSVGVLGQADEPPDLTHSDLRSVSPVHQVYLANMGVRASLSLPISVGGQLVALIAAHHLEPRQLPLDTLEALARCARAHSLALSVYQSGQRMRMVDGLDRRFEPMRQMLRTNNYWMDVWPHWGPWLMHEWSADGVTLCIGDLSVSLGVALETAALQHLDEWFCQRQGELVWPCDSLTRAVPGQPMTPVAGVLAIRVPLRDGLNLRLYLCRSEYVHTVAWGGQPDKPQERLDGVLSIAPRRSFERWVEKRLGYCRGWNHEDRLLALRLRELLVREL